jgi:predicted hotdog family 3-hydroxylacyl-ACP dehydratase
LLDHAQIEALIPHAGPMVLIDRVLSFDETTIRCVAVNHTAPDNPLRVGGVLPAVCGAEYGAQAAAIHGPALAGERERAGQVVLLRDVVWQVSDLSAVADPLSITAECVHKSARNLAYGFAIMAGERELLRGECGIILA